MAVGLVTSTVVFAGGVAFIAGGVALAGAGIAEAGATGGAGIVVTVWAVHEAMEFAVVGTTLIAASALVANESWIKAIRCGGIR